MLIWFSEYSLRRVNSKYPPTVPNTLLAGCCVYMKSTVIETKCISKNWYIIVFYRNVGLSVSSSSTLCKFASLPQVVKILIKTMRTFNRCILQIKAVKYCRSDMNEWLIVSCFLFENISLNYQRKTAIIRKSLPFKYIMFQSMKL